MPSRTDHRRDLDRLDNLMGRAAAEAHELSALLERQHLTSQAMAGVARVLRDSAERHRQVLSVLRAISGTKNLTDAKRLATNYLRSIA